MEHISLHQSCRDDCLLPFVSLLPPVQNTFAESRQVQSDLYAIFAWYLEALARGTLSIVFARVQTNSFENAYLGDRPISSVVLHADSIVYRPTLSFAACKYRLSMYALGGQHTTTCSSSAVPLSQTISRLIHWERVSPLKRGWERKRHHNQQKIEYEAERAGGDNYASSLEKLRRDAHWKE